MILKKLEYRGNAPFVINWFEKWLPYILYSLHIKLFFYFENYGLYIDSEILKYIFKFLFQP